MTLLYPNGGEVFRTDSTVGIRWISTNYTGTMMVAYSSDNGSSWQLLDTVSTKPGRDSLVWRVPKDSTVQARIVVGTIDGKTRDTSNASFTVVPPAETVGIADEESASGGLGSLGIFPNPSSGSAEIRWTQPAQGEVTITIFSSDGAIARAIDMGRRSAGAQRGMLHEDGLPSGSYIYEIACGGRRVAGRMVVRR